MTNQGRNHPDSAGELQGSHIESLRISESSVERVESRQIEMGRT